MTSNINTQWNELDTNEYYRKSVGNTYNVCIVRKSKHGNGEVVFGSVNVRPSYDVCREDEPEFVVSMLYDQYKHGSHDLLDVFNYFSEEELHAILVEHSIL